LCRQRPQRLLVQCRFGQSRSRALADAVSAHFGLDFQEAFRTRNCYVYRLV
jgi:hypothetical protein